MEVLFSIALEHRLLPAGAILALAVIAAVASRKLGLPLLITFLGLGMVLGSDGIGGIYFDNASLARTIGILALIAILFEGGLTSDWREIRPVAFSVFLLSTLGVLVTAGITAVAASRSCSAPWSVRPTRPRSFRRSATRRCRTASRACSTPSRVVTTRWRWR